MKNIPKAYKNLNPTFVHKRRVKWARLKVESRPKTIKILVTSFIEGLELIHFCNFEQIRLTNHDFKFCWHFRPVKQWATVKQIIGDKVAWRKVILSLSRKVTNVYELAYESWVNVQRHCDIFEDLLLKIRTDLPRSTRSSHRKFIV